MPWHDAVARTWRLRLDLPTRWLDPPAVQWAVFHSDPWPEFERRRAAALDGSLHDWVALAADAAARRERQLGVVHYAWDSQFEAKRGDQVYQLTPRGVLHASNEPPGPRWVVTKIAGRHLCWSLPFTAAFGEEARLTLDDGNVIDLEAHIAG